AQLDATPLVEQERDALIVTRLLIAQGDVGPALRALEHWRTMAEIQGRASSQIEILALIAIAQFVAGELIAAGQSLAQAIALGQADGFKRLFLDEGERMAALLQAALPSLIDKPAART